MDKWMIGRFAILLFLIAGFIPGIIHALYIIITR